jgi:hypothetical protein
MEKASSTALSSSRNIEKSFTMMGAAITAATGVAVTSLGYLIDKTEETVFTMSKLAAQAGVSIEAFSKLAYAAKLAGMPQDQLASMLDRMSHSSFEAASGSKAAADAYAQLGVSTTNANGTFKTADQLFVEVAKSLHGFQNDAGKTSLMITLMGRSGAQASEMLEILATRFDQVGEEATRLGVVFTQQTAAGAMKLHESMVMIEEAGLGLSVRLLQQVSPALEQIADKIIAFASSADGIKTFNDLGEELATIIRDVAGAFEFVANHATAFKIALEALVAIRLGSMFGGMIASASTTANILGKLGIASLNLGGNLLGIKNASKLAGNALEALGDVPANFIGPLEDGTIRATRGLYSMEAGAIALKTAMLEIVVPAALAAGAVYAFGLAWKDAHYYSDLKADTGKSWWTIQIAEMQEAKSNIGQYLEMLIGVQSATNNFYSGVATRLGDKNPSWMPKTEQNKSADTDPKPTKRVRPTEGPEKVDELGKKLDELKIKAQAAQLALALVGANPQAQRDLEIYEKYNLFLTEQKVQLDKLTASKRAAAEADAFAAIKAQINGEAAVKYATELFSLNESLRTSTNEHLEMAAAIGKSADAMQDAAIKAQVASKFQKEFGANWQSDPKALADSKTYAASLRAEMNAANAVEDQKAINSSEKQIDAQLRLNDAILNGAEAKRQAAIAAEQAAIHQDFIGRGDTGSKAEQDQIALVREKSDADKMAADLERASSLDRKTQLDEELKQLKDATAAALEHGKALDYRAILAANKEAWEKYNEAQDKDILATGGLLDGLKVALAQIARDTESNAQRMANAISGAVTTLNDSIAKLMTTGSLKEANFGGAFKSIADNLAKQGLQRAEGVALNKLGLGGAGKPDGSQTKPFWVKMTGQMPGVGSGGGGSSTAQSTASGIGGFLQKLFGGGGSGGSTPNPAGDGGNELDGFADGGYPVPGMPSIVGEKGPELFIPHSAGAIVPNSALKNGLGDTHHYHIDARGAHDPAQVEAAVDRAMYKHAPGMAKATSQAIHDRNLRLPLNRRGS